MALKFAREQKVCNIGGIKIGGQPGENPPVLFWNMFQKGDVLLKSRKNREFDRETATKRIHEMERWSKETGLPALVVMVANTADEMAVWIDFYTSVTDLPFGVDIWKADVRMEATKYVAEKGLMDRFLYNSITPWDEDIPGQVAAIKDMGVKHVVVQAFDVEDMGPKGRVSALKKLLPMVEKGNFESIIVDTAVMGLPLTAVSLIGNRLVKEEFGLPVGCAPANGTYMWKKEIGPENVSRFVAADAAMEAITAIESDFIFPGPMTALDRVYPAVAAAYSMFTVKTLDEGLPLPSGPNPLSLLFPDVVETLTKK